VQVVLYLCSLFNSYGVGMVLKAVVSGVVAAVAYPQILTVVSVAVLLGSLFWISGFLFITLSNRRWGRSSEALVMLLSAPQDQLDEVPVYLRFWMTQVRCEAARKHAVAWQAYWFHRVCALSVPTLGFVLPVAKHIMMLRALFPLALCTGFWQAIP